MAISFNYETDFKLREESNYSDWVCRVLASESFVAAEIAYIFCEDNYLLKINQEYLNHDTFTDIITFDYSEGTRISGDIFISVERVLENAGGYGASFMEELMRVMAHGVLHLMGYKDKTSSDADLMRRKENEKIELFHVER